MDGDRGDSKTPVESALRARLPYGKLRSLRAGNSRYLVNCKLYGLWIEPISCKSLFYKELASLVRCAGFCGDLLSAGVTADSLKRGFYEDPQ